MSLTQWLFQRREDGCFHRVSQRLFSDFFWGKARLPIGPEPEVLTAEVLVDVEDRVALRVTNIMFRRYGVDHGGIRGEREAFRIGSLIAATMVVHTSGVESAASRFARRQIEVETSWKPSPEDWTALELAVNRRAKVPLLGVKKPQPVA